MVHTIMAIAQPTTTAYTATHELLFSTIDDLVALIRQQHHPDPLAVLNAVSHAAEQLCTHLLGFSPQSTPCTFVGNTAALTRPERSALPTHPSPADATELLHPYATHSAAAQTRAAIIPDEHWHHSDLRRRRLALGIDEFALIAALVHPNPATTTPHSDQVSPLWLCLQVDARHNGWPGPTPTDFAPLLMLLRVAAPLYRTFVHDVLVHRQALLTKLSRPQQEIIPYLLDGMSEQQIADTVDRSKHTIHDHIKTIYNRWCINSRIQLVSTWLTPTQPSFERPHTTTRAHVILNRQREALRQN